jgi:methyl-accepting chemotaxis protein
MDQMTQQNGALVEQSAAASRTLQEEAQAMYDKMSEFSIDGHHAAEERPAQVKRPAQPAKVAKPATGTPPKFVGQRANGVNNGKGKPAAPAIRSTAPKSAEDWKEF